MTHVGEERPNAPTTTRNPAGEDRGCKHLLGWSLVPRFQGPLRFSSWQDSSVRERKSGRKWTTGRREKNAKENVRPGRRGAGLGSTAALAVGSGMIWPHGFQRGLSGATVHTALALAEGHTQPQPLSGPARA